MNLIHPFLILIANMISKNNIEKVCNKFFEDCVDISNLSVSNKRKVGAVIIEYYETLIYSFTVGHNHNIINRLEPCENDKNETFGTVVHAEESAIFSYLNRKSKDRKIIPIILSTYSPCFNCARMIIQSGIKILVFQTMHEKNFTEILIDGDISVLEMLKKSGIKVYQYTKENINHERENNGILREL